MLSRLVFFFFNFMTLTVGLSVWTFDSRTFSRRKEARASGSANLPHAGWQVAADLGDHFALQPLPDLLPGLDGVLFPNELAPALEVAPHQFVLVVNARSPGQLGLPDQRLLGVLAPRLEGLDAQLELVEVAGGLVLAEGH